MKMDAYETVLHNALYDTLKDLEVDSGTYTFQVIVDPVERDARAICNDIDVAIKLPQFTDTELKESYVCIIEI
ncbi:TPA: hypothetical protein I4G69_003795 [Enterobacter asburiae]|nr:hypothetical protein [Enterobacter asburiae]